jgi:O-6-methylguanine DNA methyltransferase
MPSFKERVHEVVRSIPEGRTMTYKQVAEAVGSPKAFRCVGSIMARNYDPSIPCHRVVRGDGAPGNYNRGGPDRKAEILREEVARCA